MRAETRMWERLDDNGTYAMHVLNVIEECHEVEQAHQNGGGSLKRGPMCKHGCLDQCGGILCPNGPTKSSWGLFEHY